MPGRESLGRIAAAMGWLRPRVIADLAARTRRAQREVQELRATVSALNAQVTALSSQAADAARALRQQSRHIELLTTIRSRDEQERDALAAWTHARQTHDAAAHVRRAVSRACVDADPFPHAVIPDLLPRKVYEHAVAALPPAICFDERPAHKARFLRPPFSPAPAYARQVWDELDTVLGDLLPQLLLDSFRPHIDAYLSACGGPSLESLRLKVMDTRLLLRRPGYAIPPHRDPHWGFLTMLVYLVRRGETSDYGTQLYRVTREGQPTTTGEVHYVEGEYCELARNVPSVANTALVFLNSHGAHGAAIPADAPAGTERYVYQVRIGPDSASARRIVANLPDTVRRRWAVYRGKDIAAAPAYES